MVPGRFDHVGVRMIIGGVVWLALLVAPALCGFVRDGNLADRGWFTFLALVFVAIVATLRFGSYMGVRRCGFPEVLVAAVAGTTALMLIYGQAWLEQPDPNFTNDNAAGAGMVIIGLPVFLIVLALLGVGALTGRIISRRHPTPGARLRRT
jgi:hypothetical protein